MERKECTVKEICEHYGITSVTLDRHRKKGLPFIKKGRRVYFILEDVEEWMQGRYKVKKYNYEENKNPVN